MGIESILNKEMITQNDVNILIEARKNNQFEFVLIDVRESDEYNSARIEEANYLMPLSCINNFLSKIKDIALPKVIYCRTDRRSKMVYEFLKENGIKSYYLKGGITDYKGKII